MTMSLPDIATVAAGAVVVLGFLGAALRWLFKRGGKERASDQAIERNTLATEKLTQEMIDFKSVVVDMFHELDKRVTVLETTRRITTVVESEKLESR